MPDVTLDIAKAVAAAPQPDDAVADANDAGAPAFAHEETAVLAPLYALPRLELVEGQGAWVRDAGGREYLDFTSGIAVNAFGHAPRGLAEALSAQLARLGHCSRRGSG